MNRKQLIAAATVLASMIFLALIWICALRSSLPEDGHALGQSNTTTPSPLGDTDLKIIFGLHEGGLKVYSPKTSQEWTLGSSMKDVEGVAFDAISRKVYYSTHAAIHRINLDGSGDETLFTSSTYTGIWAIGLDWVTGNLFGATRNGYIFVCKSTEGVVGSWMCRTLLSDQGGLQGIAVNPNAGTIYWTKGGSIMKASMDGANPVEIVSVSSSGLSDPMGIDIDYWSCKLFWVDYDTNMVQSSTLDGRGIQTIAVLHDDTHPWGIAVDENLLYYGNWNMESSELRSSTKTGGNTRILYNASKPIQKLAVAAPAPPPTSRSNDCAGQSCSGICVLMPSAFRCLTD